MAITTKTDICNVALSLIGDEALQLSAVDTDGTKAARQCLLHYDQTLNELVRMHVWNCCINRDQLTTAAYAEHGWDYSVALPSGCIRPLVLADSDTSFRYFAYNTEWVVESGYILTNCEDPYLTFTKIPAIATMDSLFLQCFYTLLASKISIALVTKGRELRNQYLEEFNKVLMPEARRVDAFEGNEEEPIESEWLAASYGVGSSHGTRYMFPWY